MTEERQIPPVPMTQRTFALRHKFQVIRDTTLPAQTQSAILRQCPGLSIGALEDAIDAYRFAEVLAPPIPANERKASIAKVGELAVELMNAIDELGNSERATLHEALSGGRKPGISRAKKLLRQIAVTAVRAADAIEPSAGRPPTRKAYVIRDIARELQRCGFAVDASSKGPLVFIATELFAFIEDPPNDVRSLARNALAKMDLETLDFRQSIES
jgi:hypothetical protein